MDYQLNKLHSFKATGIYCVILPSFLIPWSNQKFLHPSLHPKEKKGGKKEGNTDSTLLLPVEIKWKTDRTLVSFTFEFLLKGPAMEYLGIPGRYEGEEPTEQGRQELQMG